MRFIKGNELKIIEIELLSFFFVQDLNANLNVTSLVFIFIANLSVVKIGSVKKQLSDFVSGIKLFL